MKDKSVSLRERIRTAKAVVFDMDGVLVDSERHHFLAHQRALNDFGVKVDKPFYIANGVSTNPAWFYAKAFGQGELSSEFAEDIFNRKRQVYRELQEEEGIVVIEPAITLVKTLYERKIPLAIASAVRRDEVMRTIQHLKIAGCFAAVVTGDDVSLRNKPFPDIYLKAAESLGVDPGECVAIEDSGNGATAAVEAGMTCIVVPSEYTSTHDFSGAIVFPSFSEVEKIIKEG